MDLIVWDESFEGGIAEIDNQHKKLVGMINELHNAKLKGQGTEKLDKILGDMIAYTKYHFDAEEKLLTKHLYPNLAEQKAQHMELTRQVLEFQAKFDEGEFKNSITANRFLQKWLIDHILDNDLRAMRYIKDKL